MHGRGYGRSGLARDRGLRILGAQLLPETVREESDRKYEKRDRSDAKR